MSDIDLAPKPSLDLTRYHSKQESGEWVLFVTWYGDKLAESEPCLAIIPRQRTHYRPAVITLSSAFKYRDPRYLVGAARLFNQHLGGSDSMTTVNRLAELIHSRLDDLVKAPPRPVQETRHVAEATVTLMSGKKKVYDLREDV